MNLIDSIWSNTFLIHVNKEGGQDIKRKVENALFLNWKMEKA